MSLLSSVTAIAGRTVRGIRDSLPGGYIIGRLGSGSGPAQLIDLQSIINSASATVILPADPTATGSDTAVDGTATTFMRSDSAPAIQKTSSLVFGLAKVDGTTIIADGGVISTPIPSGAANLVYATPDGSTGAPSLRALVAADIPSVLNTTTAPAFIVSGSAIPTNGVFLPATSEVAVATNSLERMRIDSSGNVGIGTTTPNENLTVNSSTSGTIAMTSSNAAGYSQMRFKNQGASGRSMIMVFGGNTSAYPGEFVIQDETAGLNRFAIDSSGHVGIGTTSPLSKLSVTGAIATAGYAVASLPTGVDSYSRAFVTDATLPITTGLGLTPVGGGSNKVPVYTVDGTNWRIG